MAHDDLSLSQVGEAQGGRMPEAAEISVSPAEPPTTELAHAAQPAEAKVTQSEQLVTADTRQTLEETPCSMCIPRMNPFMDGNSICCT
jgi:hypothetical protein